MESQRTYGSPSSRVASACRFLLRCATVVARSRCALAHPAPDTHLLRVCRCVIDLHPELTSPALSEPGAEAASPQAACTTGLIVASIRRCAWVGPPAAGRVKSRALFWSYGTTARKADCPLTRPPAKAGAVLTSCGVPAYTSTDSYDRGGSKSGTRIRERKGRRPIGQVVTPNLC
jgi:hypothetical protein